MHRRDRDDRHRLRYLVRDRAQRVQRGGMRGVRQPLHPAAAVVIAHCSDKQGGATGSRVSDERQALVSGQRGVTNVEQKANGRSISGAVSHPGTV
ncbi:MAG: hypothetical protein JWN96_1828 [Mycobacterium sp.]|nr:hypothetical protein [Mycobacterium sp.]